MPIFLTSRKLVIVAVVLWTVFAGIFYLLPIERSFFVKDTYIITTTILSLTSLILAALGVGNENKERKCYIVNDKKGYLKWLLVYLIANGVIFFTCITITSFWRKVLQNDYLLFVYMVIGLFGLFACSTALIKIFRKMKPEMNMC